MPDGLQLSARSVASLLAQIFGPSIYDIPRFGGGDPGRHLFDLIAGPLPDPWRRLSSFPQPWRTLNPLPEPWHVALTLADAHIQEILGLDRVGTVLGGEAAQRTLDLSLRLVAEVDELCPRWPRWPRGWPPPPPPPPWWREEMTAPELFVFGTRFLAASELAQQGQLQQALTSLGEKALNLSIPSG